MTSKLSQGLNYPIKNCLLAVTTVLLFWVTSPGSAMAASLSLDLPDFAHPASSSSYDDSSTSWESNYNVRKAAHFSLSAVGTESLLKIGQLFNDKHQITFFNRFLSSTLMLGVGIEKELYDRRVTGLPFNTKDIGFDCLGILTGNILQWQF